MAERIYYQGYHVGWRLEGYDNVPSSVQDSFINLINEGVDAEYHEQETSKLYTEAAGLDDRVAELEEEVREFESLERDLRDELAGKMMMIKGEALR